MAYGQELILDLECCDVQTFNVENIENYLEELCNKIGMRREELHWWDYESQKEREDAEEHLAGITACQFISTSDIIIHTLDKKEQVLLNIFSCKEFDTEVAKNISLKYFGGSVKNCLKIERG